jgi:hypothetical protein
VKRCCKVVTVHRVVSAALHTLKIAVVRNWSGFDTLMVIGTWVELSNVGREDAEVMPRAVPRGCVGLKGACQSRQTC